jgi:pimeloyl-ACP methyl ester carboxylesterase
VPRYPDIEPYETGLLDTGDGNLVYWETCGNPDGVPALIVRGGPGSGCTTGNRRSFDPERFRIVLFDQRNCGRSLPHASDPAADMSINTTGHLIADMEQLREHLGVGKWLLRGGSWGVTLSLAYCFLPDGILIREAGKLAAIPGILIHGRNDLGGGVCTPWELARAWPGAELIIIEDSGHTGSTTMTSQIHAAADRLYLHITSPARRAEQGPGPGQRGDLN